jgi:Na+/H+ antiporter NhaD/arsenite permease-like protein
MAFRLAAGRWGWAAGLLAAIIFLWSCAAWTQAGEPQMTAPTGTESEPGYVPAIWSILPFALLLLCIAVMPLIEKCHKFWDSNRNKLIVALALSVPIILFYYFMHPTMTVLEDGKTVTLSAGTEVLRHVLSGALIEEYIPFIILLFGLYTISGGIHLYGDLKGKPTTNTAIMAVGGILASLIGTTGAAMLLIRLVLHANAHRRHVRHTVIFFIFIVCNIGGCLLPTGDPPLFLGYLYGVPFLWTTTLVVEWAAALGILLAVYYVWDTMAYRKESKIDHVATEKVGAPLKIGGAINLLWLLCVVAAVGVLVPGQPIPLLKSFTVPPYLREGVILAIAGLSMVTTARKTRSANHFTFGPIMEVAALFLGIFITMQAPIEILRMEGASLGLSQPWHFFWAAGGLSSFLDNAPTYAVFFETARSLPFVPGAETLTLPAGDTIRVDLLKALSLGAVFMGANTYIGNGPNFMVRAIAEHRGIKMPSFFHYMAYSICILIPIFIVLTLIFFIW